MATLVSFLVLATPAAAERPGWWSLPTISGAPEVGAVIVASDGEINCSPTCAPNGPEPSRSGTYYEWLSCAGAGGGNGDRPTGGLPSNPNPAPGCQIRVPSTKGVTSYTVRPEDAGRFVQLHVTVTNYDCGEVNRETGEQECRYSSGNAYTPTIGPIGGSSATAPTSTAAPTVGGVAKEGQTLTASNGSWNGAPTGFAYAWRRCAPSGNPCAAIAGATGSSYTLGEADVGNRLQVTVTATNARGSASATSAFTDVVASSALAPANTALPTIAGIVEDRQTLTAAPGRWSGTAPISYAYQWLRCSTKLRGCAAIDGATQETYRVGREDLGARLVVAVTASNRGGSGKATSPRTTHVVAARPRPGSEVLAVTEIVAPNRLVISVVKRSATAVRARGRLVLTVRVTDRRGFLIEGARVQLAGARAAGVFTDAKGTAVVRLRAGLLPGKLVVTVTASKPGDTAVTGRKSVAVLVRR